MKTIEISWDANTEPDLAGYRVYGQNPDGSWGEIPVADVPAGTLSINIPDITDGDYRFAITAYDSTGNESGQSDAVRVVIDTVPPAKPTGLRVLIKN